MLSAPVLLPGLVLVLLLSHQRLLLAGAQVLRGDTRTWEQVSREDFDKHCVREHSHESFRSQVRLEQFRWLHIPKTGWFPDTGWFKPMPASSACFRKLPHSHL